LNLNVTNLHYKKLCEELRPKTNFTWFVVGSKIKQNTFKGEEKEVDSNDNPNTKLVTHHFVGLLFPQEIADKLVG
jgi:hypothetical protein